MSRITLQRQVVMGSGWAPLRYLVRRIIRTEIVKGIELTTSSFETEWELLIKACKKRVGDPPCRLGLYDLVQKVILEGMGLHEWHSA